jgi:hypothetical protein
MRPEKRRISETPNHSEFALRAPIAIYCLYACGFPLKLLIAAAAPFRFAVAGSELSDFKR